MSSLTLTVAVGTALLGAAAGVLGCFAVLRRRALLGDVLSHASLPGLCIAFLILGDRQFAALLLGALVAGLCGLGLVALIGRWTRTKEDAAIGIALSTFFGAGIVLLSVIQRMPGGGSKAGLESYIFGQAATMTWSDVRLIAAVAGLVLLTLLACYKEFKLYSFDPEFTAVQGWSTTALDAAMMGSIALVTVVGLPAVGVVLMAAMLIIPAASARFWVQQLEPLLILSGVFGALCGLTGTLVSAGVWQQFWHPDSEPLRLPTGPVIVLTGSAIFIISLAFAPQRGLLAGIWQRWTLNRRTAVEHLLRTLYEQSEPQLPTRPALPVREVAGARSWSRLGLLRVLARAKARGWIETTDGHVRLTVAGLDQAAAVTRRHRLWELFLIQNAGVSSEHVDRAADSIEHFLSPALLASLQSQLADAGKVPTAEGDVPLSPHTIQSATRQTGVEGRAS